MEYATMKLKDSVIVSDIVTIHYFEYASDYMFTGEQHNFWELVYIDHSSAIVTAGNREFTLNHGDCFFHTPNQWHNIKANGVDAPNVVIISFYCDSLPTALGDRIYHLTKSEKDLISQILSEFTEVFSTPLGDYHAHYHTRRSDIPFGAEQLMKLYLTQLIIMIIRDSKSHTKFQTHAHNNELFTMLIEYFEKNISKQLTIAEIAQYANISKSTLKELFKKEVNMGAVQYFNKLKINKAKVYIREGNYNISQIAELLGYDSIHYFSRQFKNIIGLSPTEYSKSVKSKMKQKD